MTVQTSTGPKRVVIVVEPAGAGVAKLSESIGRPMYGVDLGAARRGRPARGDR
jgi:hypothetical protein